MTKYFVLYLKILHNCAFDLLLVKNVLSEQFFQPKHFYVTNRSVNSLNTQCVNLYCFLQHPLNSYTEKQTIYLCLCVTNNISPQSTVKHMTEAMTEDKFKSSNVYFCLLVRLSNMSFLPSPDRKSVV